MKSLGQKLQQCSGLLGTRDLTQWEEEFLQGVMDRTEGGTSTSAVTDKQAGVIERIYAKHFAG